MVGMKLSAAYSPPHVRKEHEFLWVTFVGALAMVMAARMKIMRDQEQHLELSVLHLSYRLTAFHSTCEFCPFLLSQTCVLFWRSEKYNSTVLAVASVCLVCKSNWLIAKRVHMQVTGVKRTN